MNVFNGIKLFNERSRMFRVPFAFMREELFLLAARFFAVKIVVAKGDEGRRNFAEANKPGKETLKIGLRVDGAERIDGVAGDKDVIWVLLSGAGENGF